MSLWKLCAILCCSARSGRKSIVCPGIFLRSCHLFTAWLLSMQYPYCVLYLTLQVLKQSNNNNITLRQQCAGKNQRRQTNQSAPSLPCLFLGSMLMEADVSEICSVLMLCFLISLYAVTSRDLDNFAHRSLGLSSDTDIAMASAKPTSSSPSESPPCVQFTELAKVAQYLST